MMAPASSPTRVSNVVEQHCPESGGGEGGGEGGAAGLVPKRTRARYGCLDGLSCSEEQYLELPKRFGKYELVDDILRVVPMADKEHASIATYLNNKGFAHARKDPVRALQAVIFPEPEPGAPRKNYRLPDLKVEKDGKVILFEITSKSTRTVDYEDKAPIYKQDGADEYVIIDREKKVLVHFSGKEKWKPVSFGEDHEPTIFEHWSVGDLDVDRLWKLSREGSPIEALVNEIEQEQESRKKAEDRAEQEKEGRKKAEDRAEQEKEGRKKAEGRAESSEKRVPELLEKLRKIEAESRPKKKPRIHSEN